MKKAPPREPPFRSFPDGEAFSRWLSTSRDTEVWLRIATKGAREQTVSYADALDAANRYAVLYRVHQAKTPGGRARKIDALVAMLARGETLHPPRSPRRREGA